MRTNLDIHLMNGEIIKLKYGEFELVKGNGVYKITLDDRKIMIPVDKVCYTDEYKVDNVSEEES